MIYHFYCKLVSNENYSKSTALLYHIENNVSKNIDICERKSIGQISAQAVPEAIQCFALRAKLVNMFFLVFVQLEHYLDIVNNVVHCHNKQGITAF